MSTDSQPPQASEKTPTVPTHPPRPPAASWWARLWQWQTLALLLIVIGVTVIALFGTRSMRSFRDFREIRAEGPRGAMLAPRPARLDAMRPWMTVRYVAVAYAVPEEYIFAQLEIPYNRRNSNETLDRLNQEYALGHSSNGDYPAIIDRVTQAIRDYRANPVPTGLRELRPWMTLRYIAASTGVPTATLLDALELDPARAAALDATLRPLDQLAHEMRLPGGMDELFQRLRAAIDGYEADAP